MSVTVTIPISGPYIPNAVTVDFPFDFKIASVDEVVVYRVVNSAFSVVPTGGYDVTIAADGEGGTVTFATAPASGSGDLYIVSDPDFAQTASFGASGPFTPATLNDLFDKAAIRDIFLKRGIDGAMRAPLFETIADLPKASSRANLFLAFDGMGNPIATAAAGAKGDPGSPGEGYATRAALAAVASPANLDDAYLTESGREGKFAFSTANLSAQVTADPQQGIYVAPSSDTTGASGAWVRKFDGPITVRWFGAVGNGVANDAAAIQAAVTFVKTLTAPHLIIDKGTYYIGDTTVTFDLPDSSTIDFIGEILSDANNKDAVTLGHSTEHRWYWTVNGIKVRRSSFDTTTAPGAAGGSIGVRAVNLTNARIDVRRIGGFSTGVLCIGNSAGADKGFAYNVITLGILEDNRTNLRVSMGGTGGFANENVVVGGSFRHSTTYPAVSTRNLIIDDVTGAGRRINNWLFLKPSFEDLADPAGDVVAAQIGGQNIRLVQPRLENPSFATGYQLVFTASSLECKVTTGFGIYGASNISDLGVRNEIETNAGMSLVRQTPVSATEAVLKLQSVSSSSARLLQFLNSGGVEQGFIDGSGNGQFRTVKDNLGNQLLTNRNTGWAADTGTGKKTANASYVVPTAEATYTQATIQALMNAVGDASKTIKSLKDALIAHGIIGA